MTPAQSTSGAFSLVAEWPFPTSAALGSSVRAQGIEREIKARLPYPDRKHLSVDGNRLVLAFADGQEDRFEAASTIVRDVLDRIDALPVLPGEAEDILTISSRERLKWTKDGRLKSAGTRTVKLRGRAKTVTFHVFDPPHVEDVLDRDLPTIWREEDAQAATQAKRRAAAKAAATRAGKGRGDARARKVEKPGGRSQAPRLEDWDAFEAAGLLR